MRIGVVDSGQKIVTSGLVLHLDAAQKRSYPGTGTTWTDISGGGNNGTLTNGPTFNTGNGGYIAFSAASSQYVVTSAAPTTAMPLTLLVWVNITSITAARGLIAIYEKVNSHRCQVTGSGTGLVATATGTTTSASAVISPTPTSTWVMVTAVFSSATSRTIYTNNAQNATTNTVNIGTQNAFTEVALGARYSGSLGLYLEGNIAIGLIYNKALTTDEITQNYNALKSRFGL